MSNWFPDATLALSLLPPPTVMKAFDYEMFRTERLNDLKARLIAAGIPYNVDALESDPGVILQ